jgi:hypothetical protein
MHARALVGGVPRERARGDRGARKDSPVELHAGFGSSMLFGTVAVSA